MSVFMPQLANQKIARGSVLDNFVRSELERASHSAGDQNFNFELSDLPPGTTIHQVAHWMKTLAVQYGLHVNEVNSRQNIEFSRRESTS